MQWKRLGLSSLYYSGKQIRKLVPDVEIMESVVVVEEADGLKRNNLSIEILSVINC